MQHLFSPAGYAALHAVVQRRPLLAFDFDGTLALIVAQPDMARVSSAVAHNLQQLIQSLPVAIITGRDVEDVRQRLGFEPHYIIGNHGAEDPATAITQDTQQALDSLRAHLYASSQALHAAGIGIEDKSQSLALHYRLATDPAQAQALIDTLAAQYADPAIRAFGGKMVVNFVPADAPNKAHAVSALMERCRATGALYVGDDVNDEPVFALHKPGLLTVRIGRDDPGSQADFFLDSTQEVAAMLQKVRHLLQQDPAH